jgi:galactokinase
MGEVCRDSCRAVRISLTIQRSTGTLSGSMSLPSPRHFLRISAPGRVCLFGEHQDYLHLPVVPCAISLRVAVEGTRSQRPRVELDLPDIRERESFPIDGILSYERRRDYFKSAVNVVHRHGFVHSAGIAATVRGTIPINTGTSSSSALVVAWVDFLVRMSDQAAVLPPERVARLAHEAEVLEFNEPGGMMDHFSSAFGHVITIEFVPSIVVAPLAVPLKTFVLGDSGEPKDTTAILARVKNQVLEVADDLHRANPEFSLQTVDEHSLARYTSTLTVEPAALLRGTVRNREITRVARRLLGQTPLDHRHVGTLLLEHQAVLRDVLRISTPKIDRMLDAAMGAGAYGGKINGSGGGGCMFAYAPERPEEVAEAIARVGGKPYVVTADDGVRDDTGREEETNA